ncbi:MAG: sugar phosphate nucleotidyltransferase [Candidatus Tyrphobacter sp.]
MKAVVMAGGEGSRLRPLTSRLPKPLVPVANKPVMQHIIELLRRHGITEIVATLHYLADEVESAFGDGSALGVRLQYVVEDTPLGTAGAVKLAQDLLGGERFIVISGDAITDLDLQAVLAYHLERDSEATIVLRRAANPLEFGIVTTGPDGRVTSFLEKPSWSEVFTDTVNTGIYVLEPGVLGCIEPGRVCDFSRDVFPAMLSSGRRLHGYVTQGYWTDIGTLVQYQQANYDAAERLVNLEIDGERRDSGIWAGRGCRIDATATLVPPVILGNEVTIAAGARIEGPTVLGSGSSIGEDARVLRSITWEQVHVGKGAGLYNCTIADRNTIKDRATVGESTAVGRDCVIGHDATVRPNLKLWPEKWVRPHSIVSMSLIYGMRWPGSLFGDTGVTGIANVEITPGFATRLGQAYGSSLEPGDRVVTGRGADSASQIVLEALNAGLRSTGVNVAQAFALPAAVIRHELGREGQGGVHVRLGPCDSEAVLIEFLTGSGTTIPKSAERRIEHLFFREDFRRTPMDQLGCMEPAPNLLESYVAHVVRALDAAAIARARHRVVVDYGFGNGSVALPGILDALGVDVVALNERFDAGKARAYAKHRSFHLRELAEIVRSLGTDFGILIDDGSETLAVVDRTGRILEGQHVVALIVLLCVRAHEGTQCAIPPTAPNAIESLAAKYGGTAIRTRSDRRALTALIEAQSRRLSFAAGIGCEPIFPEFHPDFDALYACGKLIELLALERADLSEVADLVPDWHMSSRNIVCPWERKGRIMRELREAEHLVDAPEALDGIRVRRDGGWVLVLPDGSDPAFKVFAEGPNTEAAVHYADEVARRIELLAGV